MDLLTLKQICLKHGTDKGMHKINSKGEVYADIYEKYFSSMRNKKINILELGVKSGCSIRAFREYFPNANIYAIDIDPNCIVHNDPDNKIFVGIMSQTDKVSINSFLKDLKFDIILDDASHVNKFTIESYNILNDRLNSQGLYIIEDLGNSYFKLETDFSVSKIWPGMKYNTTSPSDFNNDIIDIHNFTNNLIEKLDYSNNYATYLELSDISFIHRYKFIIVICKN